MRNKETYHKHCAEFKEEVKLYSAYKLTRALIEQDEIIYGNKYGEIYLARARKQIITNEIKRREDQNIFSQTKPLI